MRHSMWLRPGTSTLAPALASRLLLVLCAGAMAVGGCASSTFTTGPDGADLPGVDALPLPDAPEGEPPTGPGACNDQRQNGDETDVDCGGSCYKCTDGLACQ